MQTQISIFQFQAEKSVRVEFQNGEPLFCLKDVAAILEIQDTKSKNFNLNPKGVEKIPCLTKGGKQELTFINEPNLYRVIFRSNKPVAVKFQDWIFEEVIPTIRKTGSYVHADSYLNEYEAAQIQEAVKQRQKRTGETSQAIYIKLHSYMKVPSFYLIRQVDFQAALNFLASIENALVKSTQTLSDDVMISLNYLLLHAQDIRLFIHRYLPAFDNLGIDNGGALWSYVHHTRETFSVIREFCLHNPIEFKHAEFVRQKIIQTAII